MAMLRNKEVNNIPYFFQLNAALLDLHDVFFMLSRAHQMAIIAADRELLKEKWLKEKVRNRGNLF